MSQTTSAGRIAIELPAAVGQWRMLASTAADGVVADIRSGWMPPIATPQMPPWDWKHSDRREQDLVLAEWEGRVTLDRFEAGRCELTREVWLSADRNVAALRQTIGNRGPEPLTLQALLPLRCDGPDSLQVGGCGADNWDVLAQKRFKNDGPTAFRPGVFDGDLAMAEKPVGPTGEVVEDTGDETTTVRADPFCVLRKRADPQAPALMIGYLSQTGHLARIVLQFVNDGASGAHLEHLTAECEFDGVALATGAERSSQWLIFAVGETQQLIVDFADRVGRYHRVKPPQTPPPSVWCSFSVYGESFNEQLFNEDLDDLASRRVPFDVFLIDGGWEKMRGQWEPDPALWPGGMRVAAERIVAHGYRPALWTAPFTVSADSPVAREHPDWMARTDEAEPYEYMGGLVLDTTAPGACDHLEQLYRQLTFDWGYHYHKFDFMRGIFNNPAIRFADAAATRLDAYRRGLRAIRRGVGQQAYLSVCGGHFGGSLGLADAQRSGSDVRGSWTVMKPRIKQNLLRTWMHRLWHVDPDAMLLRRRTEPLVEGAMGGYTLGELTDDEVQTVVLNQYLGGQLICLGEAFRYLDEDRRALLRHTIPSVNAAAVPLDPFEPVAPSQLVTRVNPRCGELEPWNTLALINWDDSPRGMETVSSPRRLSRRVTVTSGSKRPEARCRANRQYATATMPLVVSCSVCRSATSRYRYSPGDTMLFASSVPSQTCEYSPSGTYPSYTRFTSRPDRSKTSIETGTAEVTRKSLYEMFTTSFTPSPFGVNGFGEIWGENTLSTGVCTRSDSDRRRRPAGT